MFNPITDKENVINLYNSGKLVPQIAKIYNCYPQRIENLLKKFNIYKSNKPNQGNIRYFENIDTNLKAYFLGFIAADGCLQNNGSGSYGLSITLHSKDRIILDKLKEEIGCENKILHLTTPMTHNNQPKDHVRFSLFNKLFVQDLRNTGIEERKSTTMKNIIPNISKEFRNSFILGYFDGDGSVITPLLGRTKMTKKGLKTYPNLTIIVSFRGTKEFLEGIVKELNINFYSLTKDKIKNCHTLLICKKSSVIKFFKIYNNNNFYLTRKYNKFLERIDKGRTISSS